MDYKNELGNWEEIILEPSGDTLPVGSIAQFGGKTAPTNWLFCNGQAVSRETYAELFSVIGTTYGDGDGSTTFNVPDFIGRVPVGLDEEDTDFDTLGETGGEKTHKLVKEELPNYVLKGLKWKDSSAIIFDKLYDGNGYKLQYEHGAGNTGQIDGFTMRSGGNDQPHNNMQPYTVTNFIIKAKQSVGLVGTVSEDITDTNNNAVPTCETVKDYVDKKSNDILNGTVLYESTTGTTGTVTLSESVANYDYIDIHFKTNDGNFIKTERLYKPNGKATSLMYWHLSSNTFGYVKVRSININGTTITNSNYSEFSISTGVSASASNNIYITRVVGYK